MQGMQSTKDVRLTLPSGELVFLLSEETSLEHEISSYECEG